eukprot:1948584-Rhodomonas_salina.2
MNTGKNFGFHLLFQCFTHFFAPKQLLSNFESSKVSSLAISSAKFSAQPFSSTSPARNSDAERLTLPWYQAHRLNFAAVKQDRKFWNTVQKKPMHTRVPRWSTPGTVISTGTWAQVRRFLRDGPAKWRVRKPPPFGLRDDARLRFRP